MPVWAWAVVGLLLILAVYALVTFNRLVRHRNENDNAWSQIDVQLRRRYDLIPNLVEAVRGYAGHERDVFERVTLARAAGISARGVGEQADAENQISQALRSLLAVAEAYPELKADQNFLALHEELTATEGKITFAREFYNDAVLDYNNLVQQFPSMFVARFANFRTREYFEIEETATGPVRVEY